MQSLPTPADVSPKMSQNIIALFKKLGYRTYIRHRRYYVVPGYESENYVVGPFTRRQAEQYGYTGRQIYGRGGSTDIEVYEGETLLFQGGSRCSMSDQFVKKYGRQVALCRALSKIGVDVTVSP